MSHVVKTAVSLPREDFERLEAIRRRTHTSRSKLLVEAFRLMAARQQREALEERYVAGYRRHPEVVGDLRPFYHAGLASLGTEEW